MANILIAYNNMPGVGLYDFFENCSDNLKQKCIETHHKYSSLTPPSLVNDLIRPMVVTHDVCYIAAHGDSDGIVNENEDYFVSVNTINYDFQEKIVYSVSCKAGQNLKENMIRMGVKLFVGYNDDLIIGTSEDIFVKCANSGINSILDGNEFGIAKEHMINTYNDAIDNATFIDGLYLLNNREHLVFEGDMNAKI